ncbi:MAG TPA: MFS transporter [Roseiflexaceae bacterium]|nr:MFS transporter [Roseiflexaceae bacterium]
MKLRSLRWLPRLTPAVARYFVAVGLVGFAIDGGIYSVLLNLFLLRLGYGPETIGLINAAGTLTFALTCLPAGVIGARWGSRPIMLLGLSLLAAGSMLLPLADTLASKWRLAWLLVNVSLLYLGLALYFVNTAPFVMEAIRPEQRTHIFSLQTALLALAAFLGSLIGGFLPPGIAALLGGSTAQAAPYRYALLIAGLAILPAMLALHAARPAAITHEAAPAPTVATPAPPIARALIGLLTMIAIVRVLQVAGLAVTTTFFNVYLDSALLVSTARIGLLIALGRLLGIPAALATGTLTSRYGTRAVVIGASLGTALSILPIALIPHWGAAGLSLIGVVGLSGIRYPASIVYFLELVPPAQRATVSGLTEMAAGICFTAMTFGGGYIIAAFGYQSLFLLGAALTGLSALVFWRSFRQPPHGHAPHI